MATNRKPLVVFGSITMDLVTRTPRIPLVGQTVIGSSFESTPGGKGANQAIAAARLGYPAKMIGKVGDDAYGPELIENLKLAGVDTSSMTQSSGSSGLAPLFVADDGSNAIVVVPGANGKMDRATVDANKELLSSAGMVLCQLEIPMDTLAYVIDYCYGCDVPVMLDPAPAAALPDSIWSRVYWFTPNETEAAFYAPEAKTVEQTAKHLLSRGVRGVVLKRGAEGAYIATATGRSTWVKAFEADVIDTVAAGDCFNGAFAVGLLEGQNPFAAARMANAAAAICVTRKGAQASMPTRAEVDAFLKSKA